MRYNVPKGCAARSCRALRRRTHMCSSNLSDAANMSRHGSTLCSPTVEKILCRSPFRSGHMSAICARLSKGKGRFTRGWKPQVSTLLCARAASAQLPAEVQRKTLRPLGANTPAAVRVPRSAGAEKKVPPGQGEPAHAVCVPRLITARKRKKPPYEPYGGFSMSYLVCWVIINTGMYQIS